MDYEFGRSVTVTFKRKIHFSKRRQGDDLLHNMEEKLRYYSNPEVTEEDPGPKFSGRPVVDVWRQCGFVCFPALLFIW